SLINELLRLGIQEGQRIPGLFSFTLHVLDALESARIQAQNAAFLFQGAFLKLIGFSPLLDSCVECHARPGPGSLLVVFPKQGGILCKNCRSSEAAGLRISWETSRILVQCITRDIEGLSRLQVDAHTARQLWSFYELFLQYYLELRINSFAFIKQLDF
ncbi:MAG: DNA repair protein RecO, partial [Planctomycetota bacterium]